MSNPVPLDTNILLQQADLLGATPNTVAIFDEHDRLRYANPAFRETFFVQEGEALTWRALVQRNYVCSRGGCIYTSDFEKWITSAQARRGKVGHRAFEMDLHSGQWLWMSETVSPDGWMLCVGFDVTGLRADERSIRHARDLAIRESQTDALTGVANRRYVMDRIDDCLLLQDHGAKAGRAGCLAVLDIDNFKSINDRFGHDMGDRVLRHFTSNIVRNLRVKDCFGRIGGEEFALLMPETSMNDATKAVQRLLDMIATSSRLNPSIGFSYTFSAGLTDILSGDTRSTLYRRADQALLAAKRSGKARYVTASAEVNAVATKPLRSAS